MLRTHLDGVEFLLQYILNLLVQCGIVQPAVEAATHDDIGPDYTAGGSQEKRLIDALPQLILLALGTACLGARKQRISYSSTTDKNR